MVTVYPDGTDTVLHFRVAHGHVAEQTVEDEIRTQQAFVKLSPADRASLREALADDLPEPQDAELPGDTAWRAYAEETDVYALAHDPHLTARRAFAAGWDARRRFDQEA